MEPAEPTAVMKPEHFIASIKGRAVQVKLTDNSLYEGKFVCIDGHLNVVLEEAKEIGGLKRTLGELFIRGNNLSYLSRV